MASFAIIVLVSFSFIIFVEVVPYIMAALVVVVIAGSAMAGAGSYIGIVGTARTAPESTKAERTEESMRTMVEN